MSNEKWPFGFLLVIEKSLDGTQMRIRDDIGGERLYTYLPILSEIKI